MSNTETAGELLVIISHRTRSDDLQESEACGISSSHAFVSGDARAATERERFPRFYYHSDCNIDSFRQLANWKPLEYLQDLTFLIRSLDTQVVEAAVKAWPATVKHESRQKLVFVSLTCAGWTALKQKAST